jgi:hypothetical protein
MVYRSLDIIGVIFCFERVDPLPTLSDRHGLHCMDKVGVISRLYSLSQV